MFKFREAPVFLRILAGNASAKMSSESWAIVFAAAIYDIATLDDFVSENDPLRRVLSRFVTVVLAVRDQPRLCFHLIWNRRWPESHSFSENDLEKRKALFDQALGYLNNGWVGIGDLFALMDHWLLMAVFSEHLTPAWIAARNTADDVEGDYHDFVAKVLFVYLVDRGSDLFRARSGPETVTSFMQKRPFLLFCAKSLLETNNFRALLLPEVPSSLPELHQRIFQLVKAIPMLMTVPEQQDTVSDMAVQLLIPELYDGSKAHVLEIFGVENILTARHFLFDDVHLALLAILHAPSLRDGCYDRLLKSIVMMALNEDNQPQIGLLYILCSKGNRRFLQEIVTLAKGANLFPDFVAKLMEHLKLDPLAMMYNVKSAVPDEKAPVSYCTICLNEEKGAYAKLLCGHVFHRECILTWFNRRPYCPVCRTEHPFLVEDISDYLNKLAAPPLPSASSNPAPSS